MESSKDEAIFRAIIELTAQAEFKEASFQFFEKNKGTFEDTEENKLSHSDIHKDYIMIMEQIIEAQLKGTFEDEEIKAFYASFKDKLESYEKIDAETVDVLFGFVDFDKFKQKMVEYKNGMQDDKFKEAPSEPMAEYTDVAGDEAIQKLYNDLNSEDVSDATHQWKLTLDMAEKDGVKCKVYQRPIPGRGIKMCRNETIMRGITIGAWLQFSKNFLMYMKDDPEFSKNNSLNKEITMSDDRMHGVFFSRSKFGPMASDRESLIKQDFFQLEPKKFLLVARSTQHNDYPEDANNVRMEYFRVQQVHEEGGDLYTTGFSNIDFKGYFPTSLMNMILCSMIQGGKKSTYAKLQKIQAEINAGTLPNPCP